MNVEIICKADYLVWHVAQNFKEVIWYTKSHKNSTSYLTLKAYLEECSRGRTGGFSDTKKGFSDITIIECTQRFIVCK